MGSSGCNRFIGTNELAGDSLTFGDTSALTRSACSEEESAVDDSYLANLPLTTTWSIVEEGLALADAEGGHILGFEQSVIGFEQSVIALTQSGVATIAALIAGEQAEIDPPHRAPRQHPRRHLGR